jgi:AmpD protein
LPPGQYGGGEVVDFFTNKLDESAHPYFREINHLQVSAHFFIRRDGQLVQFVPTSMRAWHAGESVCLGKSGANDFTIGIELEGLDTDKNGYTNDQYTQLDKLLKILKSAYPEIKANNIFAHSDIAPGRKPDPGPFFDWRRVV